MSVQVFSNVLLAVTGLAPLAIAFFVAMATCRYFHFSIALAFTGAPCLMHAIMPPSASPGQLMLGVAVAIVCLGTLGGLLEAMLMQPLAKRGATRLHLTIVSLTVLFIGQDLLGLWSSGRTIRFEYANLALGSSSWAGAIWNYHQLLAAGINLASVGSLVVLWRSMHVGLVFRAIQESERTASTIGISVVRWRYLAAAVAFTLAAVAGLTWTMDNQLRPDQGFDIAFSGMACVIVGGHTRLWQPLLGALILGTAQTVGGYWLPGSWEPSVTFAFCLLALLISPEWNRAPIAELRG